MSEWIARQPRVSGLLPERSLAEFSRLDRWTRSNALRLRRLHEWGTASTRRWVRAIEHRADQLAAETDAVLTAARAAVTVRLRLNGLHTADLIEAFAVIMITSERTLNMRHHHTQIRAALALLRGRVAEMATGEGKTLAATLAAGTAGLAGVPVHVVTVNDYLAERDAMELAPLYEALGLSSGAILHDMQPDARRQTYARDIVYCCNKELVFDYLKDGLRLGSSQHAWARHLDRVSGMADRQTLLRGLHFAIVDEVDSIFIDEARTPLVISGASAVDAEERQLLCEALAMAQLLDKHTDFEITERRGVQLTAQGERRLATLTAARGGLWSNAEYRDGLAVQSLTALYRFEREKDYLVDDEGKVQIIDPHTGRVMPGRTWSQGLHQLVELKEGLEMSEPHETQAEISYQNFFRKYHALAGMTGTATEVRRELRDIYGLQSEVIPLLRPSRRRQAQRAVARDRQARNARLVEWVSNLHAAGQPVLVGTATLAASEDIAACLQQAGIAHQVLNARQDQQEADIVRMAGRSGAVTIATSMAGRGTDIKLDDAARAAGGLYVLITQLQNASRVDRQLAGRAARQGDPGCVGYLLCDDDPVLQRYDGAATRLLYGACGVLGEYGRYLGLRFLQRRTENLHYRQRMALLKSDTRRQRMLAFSIRHRESA